MDNGGGLYLHVAGLRRQVERQRPVRPGGGRTFERTRGARLAMPRPYKAGIGAQGGRHRNAAANALERSGMVINSSRAIYASGGDDWREAAGRAAMACGCHHAVR